VEAHGARRAPGRRRRRLIAGGTARSPRRARRPRKVLVLNIDGKLAKEPDEACRVDFAQPAPPLADDKGVRDLQGPDVGTRAAESTNRSSTLSLKALTWSSKHHVRVTEAST